MKKKILLIPIMLISSTLAGCRYESSLIYIQEWVNHNGYMSYSPDFTVRNGSDENAYGSEDYDDKISYLIKSNLDDLKVVGTNLPKDKKERTDVYLSYSISCHLREMDYCEINIYDNGFITSHAYSTEGIIFGLFHAKDQDICYRISEEKAKYIIEKATERYLEIKETQDKEYAELLELAKMENVFNRAEETAKDLTLYCYNVDRYPYYCVDKDRLMLNELKAVTYNKPP